MNQPLDPYPLPCRRRYWHANLRLTGALLLLWFALSFLVPFFARELSFDFFGAPFSLWLTAQGIPVLYVLMVCFYAWRMNRLDHEFGVAEQ